MTYKDRITHIIDRFVSDNMEVDWSEAMPPHVLLVEDNKSDVVLTRHMLRGFFQLTDVARMSDALDLLDASSFDLILLDLNLLDIEGTASVAALSAAAPNIPIIVYSSSADKRLLADTLLCGARHCLIKGNETRYSLKTTIQKTLVSAEV